MLARERHKLQRKEIVTKIRVTNDLLKDRVTLLNTLSCGYRNPNQSCILHGKCSVFPNTANTVYCGDCADRLVTFQHDLVEPEVLQLPEQALDPIFHHRIEGLAPDKFQVNGSVIRYQDKTLFAYRKGWGNAETWLAELNSGFDAISNIKLEFPKTEYNTIGSEDARLFVHNNNLYAEWTGFSHHNGQYRTHILYSLITSSGEVISTFLPYFSARSSWEKNWAFFSHRGKLFAVYSLTPHTVLEIQGEHSWIHSKTIPVFDNKLWSCRGGSSPYLYKNEWYCFTHNIVKYQGGRWYIMGCYTFENKSPFKPKRYCDKAVLISNAPENKLHGHVPHIVFPAGAYQEGSDWIVSYGYYDRYCEIVKFNCDQLDSVLKPMVPRIPPKDRRKQQTVAAVERYQSQPLEHPKRFKQPEQVVIKKTNRPTLKLYSCIYRSEEAIGEIPCGCSNPPKVYQCSHPDINAVCIRVKENGDRGKIADEKGYAVCQFCKLRVTEPGTVGTVQEWREAKSISS